jgi:hypothetical protein
LKLGPSKGPRPPATGLRRGTRLRPTRLKLRLPVALLLLALLGPAAFQLRRKLIQRFFVDATPGPAPALTAAPPGSPGVGPAARVRVLLIY